MNDLLKKIGIKESYKIKNEATINLLNSILKPLIEDEEFVKQHTVSLDELLNDLN